MTSSSDEFGAGRGRSRVCSKIVTILDRDSSRAIVLLTLGNGCHGHGVLDMAVLMESSRFSDFTAMSRTP